MILAVLWWIAKNFCYSGVLINEVRLIVGKPKMKYKIIKDICQDIYCVQGYNMISFELALIKFFPNYDIVASDWLLARPINPSQWHVQCCKTLTHTHSFYWIVFSSYSIPSTFLYIVLLILTPTSQCLEPIDFFLF